MISYPWLILLAIPLFVFLAVSRMCMLNKKRKTLEEKLSRPPDPNGNWLKLKDLHEKLTKNEQALYKSDYRFQAISEVAFCGLFVHKFGSLVFTNSVFRSLVGDTDESAFIGKNMFEYIHPDDQVRVELGMEQDFEHYDSIRIQKKDQSYVEVNVRAKNIYYPGVGECRIVAVMEKADGTRK